MAAIQLQISSTEPALRLNKLAYGAIGVHNLLNDRIVVLSFQKQLFNGFHYFAVQCLHRTIAVQHAGLRVLAVVIRALDAAKHQLTSITVAQSKSAASAWRSVHLYHRPVVKPVVRPAAFRTLRTFCPAVP